MSSQNSLALEQRERALKLKEEALTRQAHQQQRTEERLKANQDAVAKKERANQLKSQDLIKRERKFQEDSIVLERERQTLDEAQRNIDQSKNRSMVFILPLLMIAGIIGGYFTYEQMSGQQKQFDQIAQASRNIDKLASILSLTQDEVITKSTALTSKKTELDRTKTMLSDLKTTTDQLRAEIGLLKNSQDASNVEKATLISSAENLQKQLQELKEQLEDEYLNIDIIEAVVAYQQKTFTEELRDKQSQLEQTEDEISEQQTVRSLLNTQVVEQNLTIAEQHERLVERNADLNAKVVELNEMNANLKASAITADNLKKEKEELLENIETLEAQNSALRQEKQAQQASVEIK